jgi:hypothetical protein
MTAAPVGGDMLQITRLLSLPGRLCQPATRHFSRLCRLVAIAIGSNKLLARFSVDVPDIAIGILQLDRREVCELCHSFSRRVSISTINATKEMRPTHSWETKIIETNL